VASYSECIEEYEPTSHVNIYFILLSVRVLWKVIRSCWMLVLILRVSMNSSVQAPTFVLIFLDALTI